MSWRGLIPRQGAKRSTGFTLESEDDSGRYPHIVLRIAKEVRWKIIALNNAPIDSVHQPGVNPSAERQRKRGTGCPSSISMGASNKKMRERRYTRWPGNLRPKQEGVHGEVRTKGRSI